MANTILPGYMMPLGAKNLCVFDHSGPASYTQAGVAGAITTGGDVINASDIGMGCFDNFEVDITDPTGQLFAEIQPINAGNGNAIPSVRIIWYSRVTATVGGQAQTANAEVAAATNLTTLTLRCRAWGI